MNGVIYIAMGERYIEEAKQSARSLKEHNDVPVTLFTDGKVSGPFDQVLSMSPIQDKTLKARIMPRSPYHNTLYLDTDTYITSSITDLFAILDRYDIAAAYAPRRWAHDCSIPAWFPEVNSGVFLYRYSPVTMELFDSWLGIIRGQPQATTDQPSLRRALHESQVSLYVLPPEYNARVPIPTFVSQRVYILHARGEVLEAAIANINRHRGMRVWLPLERDLYKGKGHR